MKTLFLLKLAFKNLTRYKRRTIITSSTIAIGLMMFIIVDSLIVGVQTESERNLRWYETSYLRIMKQGYWEDRFFRPLETSIPNPDEIMAKLAENHITSSKRLNFSADMIFNSDDFGEDGNMTVDVNAVDFEQDFKVFRFKDTLVEGRFPKAGADEIVLGSWFAEDIKAKVGYTVSLMTRGNGGFYQVMDMEIVGIVDCPNPNVNRGLIMMDYTAADYYLAMDGAATEINIVLPDSDDLHKEAALVSSFIGNDLTVMNWMQLGSDYFSFAKADEASGYVVLFLVFLIAAVGISNTMLMAVQERMREMGMLRALGMKDLHIRLGFLLEAGGIGFFASLTGIFLGCIINIFLVKDGIDFTFLMRSMDMGYRVSGVMKGVWSLQSMVTVFLSGLILPMLVASFSTHRSLRADIPTCLHHQ